MQTLIQLTHPAWLVLLPLASSPWWPRLRIPVTKASLAMLPPDPLSNPLMRISRIMAGAGMLLLVLAMGTPYIEQKERIIEGRGAEIIFLLDRSSSMNENFSGRYLGGSAAETKNAEARKLLEDFIQQRPHDLFGMVAFSAAPIHVMPLTEKRSAISAAIHASSDRGHGVTRMGEGLMAAIDMFPERIHDPGNSRALILVSDGAAQIDPIMQAQIQRRLQTKKIKLYWLYLRSRLGAHLDITPQSGETSSPEYLLNRFFRTLGDRYQGWEADHPDQMRSALNMIASLESQPFRHITKGNRRDLTLWLIVPALLLLMPHFMTLWFEDQSCAD